MQDAELPPWWEEKKAFQRKPMDRKGLTRLAADVVPGGAVRTRGRLHGGNETAAHALEVIDAHGTVTRAVLKRRPNCLLDGSNEWAALHAAAISSAPTPEPIAFDPTGRWFGTPAILISRLRGQARLDVPGDRATLVQIAHALAAIHDCDGRGLPATRPRWTRTCPADASPFEQEVWRWIEQLAPSAGLPSALVHLDFHPGNTLRFRGRLSGIIDWEDGARGWPAEDVAKCRAYLVLTHGPRVADDFRAAYEAEIGGPVPNLALAEASYAIGLLRQAALRSFALRLAGFPTITATSFGAAMRRFIDTAVRATA